MRNNITLEIILEKVCEHYKLNPEDVKSKRKYGNLPRARQMYFFISRKITNYKLEWIGKIVNASHCNVIHYINAIQEQKEIYPEVNKTLKEIIDLIFVPDIIIEKVDLLQLTKNYNLVVR